MKINNNVYTFLSGIFISVATDLFTSLCFEQFAPQTQWPIYISIVAFAITSAMLIYFATKLSRVQNYISEHQNIKDKNQILIESTKDKSTIWFLTYILCIIAFLASIIFMIIYFIIFA